MSRGFSIVALDSPKTDENVAGVLRACYAYEVAQVTVARHRCNSRALSHYLNTPKAHRHMPVITADDPLTYRPWGTQVVAVDLVDGAVPLPEFQHPERAIYVFGAEDGTLGARILDRAQHRVMVPTRVCMNLAAAANVVLYDRMAKAHVRASKRTEEVA